MSKEARRILWTVGKLTLNLISAVVVLWGVYELTGSRWAVGVAGSICVILFSLLFLSEIDLKGRLSEANERLATQERLLADLTERARGLQLGMVEDYDDFIRQITSMVRGAVTRVLVIRAHQSAGALPGEREYFQLTESRLKENAIPLYRRLVNVRAAGGVEQVSTMLKALGHCERFELKVWNESRFPSNYELVIADSRAVIAFSPNPGGPPQRGIAISDGRLVDHLSALFHLYWDDPRAVQVKGASALSKGELERVRAIIQEIHSRVH